MLPFRLILLISAVCTLHTIAFSQDRESPQDAQRIQWTATPQAAVQLQQATGRPLLVYVTADYCGYCRKMERDTWSNRDVVQKIRDRFIPLKLDAEKHAEIVSRLGIKGLPTTIIFNGAGEHLQTVSGYSRPEALLPVLEAASRSTVSIRDEDVGRATLPQ